MVVIINNETNTILGRFTAASPDGRKAGTPMANANSPAGGTDTKGITAMLNSLTKLDTHSHAGAVQNLKLSQKLMTENRDIVRALLKTYFKKGGAQVMITVLNKDDLQNAIKNFNILKAVCKICCRQGPKQKQQQAPWQTLCRLL